MYSIDAKIRKQQSLLIYSGYAHILFGVWSIVRIILMKFLDPDGILDLMDISYEEMSTSMTADTFVNVVVLLIILFLLIDLLIRIYIGRSAIKEGRGQFKKRMTYIIITAITVIIGVSADITSLRDISTSRNAVVLVSSVMIDLTSCIMPISIVVAGCKLRYLSRNMIGEN